MRVVRDYLSLLKLRVVLLTAEAFSIDIVKAMSLGAAEYWPKPLDLARVEQALARLLARKA